MLTDPARQQSTLNATTYQQAGQEMTPSIIKSKGLIRNCGAASVGRLVSAELKMQIVHRKEIQKRAIEGLALPQSD